MPYAKRFLAKLARFYRRIKPCTTPTFIDDKKCVKLCHKGCNTIRDEFELAELQHIPFESDEDEPDENDNEKNNNKNMNKKSNMMNRNRNKIKAEEIIQPGLPRATITITMKNNNRMAAGKEAEAKSHTYRNSDSELDEGPILETGISRMAFCRQLDSLLQRSLGHEVHHEGSYC